MGIFDPEGVTQLNPERAPVDNSSSTLIQGLTQTLRSSFQGVARPTQGNKKNALEGALFRDIEKATAEKNPTQRVLLQKRVLSNYLKQGGDLTETVRQGLETTTGQAFDFIGNTQEDVVKAQTLDSDKGRDVYAATFATHPNMTDEERINHTVNQVAVDNANDLEVERTKVGDAAQWLRTGEESYLKKISSYENTIQGLLSNSGERVPIEDIRRAELGLKQLNAQLPKPRNVSTEEFSNVRSKIDGLQQVFDTLNNLNSDDTLGQDQIRTALEVTEDALRKEQGGELTVGQSLAVGVMRGSGAKNLTNTNVISSAMVDILKNATTMIPVKETVDTLAGGSGTGGPDGTEEKSSKLDPEIRTKKLLDLNSFVNEFSSTDLNDPDIRENLTAAIADSSVHMKTSNGHFSESGVRNFFSDKVMGQVKTISQADPTIGENLGKAMQEGLDNLELKNKLNLSALTESSGLNVDTNTGEITLNSSIMIGKLGAERFQALKRFIDTDFGGSVIRALQQTNLSEFSKDARGQDIAKFALKEGRKNLPDIQQRIRTDKFLKQRRDAITTLTGAEGNVEVEGGTGGDTLLRERLQGISFSETNNPLIGSLKGASRLVVGDAPTVLEELVSGPLAKAQSIFGRDITVNDAIAKAGTSREKNTPNSRHFHGDAVDISTRGMSDNDKLELVSALQEAGFTGLGLGKNIIHADLGRRRAWAYGNDTFGGRSVSELIGEHNKGTQVAASTSSTHAGHDHAEHDEGEGKPTQLQKAPEEETIDFGQTVQATPVEAEQTQQETVVVPESPAQQPRTVKEVVQSLPVEERKSFITELSKALKGSSGLESEEDIAKLLEGIV